MDELSSGTSENGADAAFGAFREGTRLLAERNVHAAAIALERARELEPAMGSVREALARAYYGAGRYAAAEAEFRVSIEIDPVNDYAHYGLGLCRLRAGDRGEARRHLRLALGMRPDNPDYRRAWAEVAADSEEPG